MLKIGDIAPSFSLPDKDNNTVSLSNFKNKWIILYFYPKDNTPGCTTEACDFSVNIADFQNLNAVVIGISPDTPDSHKKFIEKYSLKLTLLSDQNHDILEKYDAWQLKKNYGKEYMGVLRSTFIINPEVKIEALWYGVSVKNHINEVQEKLKEAQKNNDVRTK
jgi:thioredoxin-dependent peroxiredoxin